MSYFAALARRAGYEITPEYRFAPPRRWRFDYALVGQRIAIEVEGGAWNGGRHTRGSGFIKDMEKYNEATARGWLVFRTTPKDDLGVWTYVERALRLQEDRHGHDDERRNEAG